MDTFFKRIQELLSDISEHFKKVLVMSVVASCDSKHSVYSNSNGSLFEDNCLNYGVMLEFAGNSEGNTTGMFVGYATLDDPDVRLIDLAEIRKDLKRAEDSLDAKPVSEKFEGTVVFTPMCAEQIIVMTFENYIAPSVIMEGTSLWKDKLGDTVASEKLTVAFRPSDKRITEKKNWTSDGFVSGDAEIIKSGMLCSFMLDLYASKKTGMDVFKNSLSGLYIEPGDKSIEEIIASVDRGLLVGGFSGGEPGANGEFSGVAKNAFYIENGKIKYAVNETMINGNLGDLLNNIVAISDTLICDGSSLLPYIAASGIVISGK